MFNETVIAKQVQVKILRGASTTVLQKKVNDWLSDHSGSHIYSLKYKIASIASAPYTMAIFYRET